jgi:predicted enzyme related to lactoylglutathione lyase
MFSVPHSAAFCMEKPMRSSGSIIRRPGVSEHTERCAMPDDMIQGLGTVIYHVTDLDRAKAWYSSAFQRQPYFDEPFYVGFNIAGYELGLDPNQTVTRTGRGGSVAYWRVAGIESAVQHFVALGATLVAQTQDVGGGIKVASVADPFGNLIGLIENPQITLPNC